MARAAGPRAYVGRTRARARRAVRARRTPHAPHPCPVPPGPLASVGGVGRSYLFVCCSCKVTVRDGRGRVGEGEK
jgi:hypothetical protein